MASDTGQKVAHLVCIVIVAASVTGYFIGMKSPMNPALANDVFSLDTKLDLQPNDLHGREIAAPVSGNSVVPATSYADMGHVTTQISQSWRTNLSELNSAMDPLSEVSITSIQKTEALAKRSTNRAYNGAPPTIPHSTERMTVNVCVACHANGAKTDSLRIPRMSHQFLTNCTQCHVENSPKHAPASPFRDNSFIGLPAPSEGPKAYNGAPPQIPHTTWMRVNCMSCHGPTGLHGIRSTHPWRVNCQQCHAPSSQLDQLPFSSKPNFLPPPVIKRLNGNQ